MISIAKFINGQSIVQDIISVAPMLMDNIPQPGDKIDAPPNSKFFRIHIGIVILLAGNKLMGQKAIQQYFPTQ